MTPVKTIVAGALVAATMSFSIPTPASALVVGVGPRGGVRVGVGRPFVRRPFVRRPFVRPLVRVRPGVVVRRGWHRY